MYAGKLPSMKSRVSIFTLRGLSLLVLNPVAVTIGYFLNSSDLSRGKRSVLCCQLLSCLLLLSPRLEMVRLSGVATPPIRNGSAEWDRNV